MVVLDSYHFPHAAGFLEPITSKPEPETESEPGQSFPQSACVGYTNSPPGNLVQFSPTWSASSLSTPGVIQTSKILGIRSLDLSGSVRMTLRRAWWSRWMTNDVTSTQLLVLDHIPLSLSLLFALPGYPTRTQPVVTIQTRSVWTHATARGCV